MSKKRSSSRRRAAAGEKLSGSPAASPRTRSVQAPRPVREGPRRGLLLGVLAIGAVVAVAAIAGILLGRNTEARGTSIHAEDVAAEAQGSDSAGGDVQGLGSVPAASFTYFDGSSGSFADYRGKPLVVNFFASWCTPCLRELPGFAKLHRSLGGSVAFVGLNLQDDPASGRAIIEQAGVDYDVASDPDGSFFFAFNGFAMPTTVFVSPEGTIEEVYGGELTAKELERKIGEHFST